MNKLVKTTLSVAFLFSIGQAHAQVNETSVAVNATIWMSWKADELLLRRITLSLQEFENKPKWANINTLNELEIFLAQKWFEDIQSFCISTNRWNYSGIILENRFRIIYSDNTIKIESI